MRFLHASDLYIDSPLRGLDRYDCAPVEWLRSATLAPVDLADEGHRLFRLNRQTIRIDVLPVVIPGHSFPERAVYEVQRHQY